MNMITVYHNPSNQLPECWEVVEQFASGKSIQELADDFEMLTVNHGVIINQDSIEVTKDNGAGIALLVLVNKTMVSTGSCNVSKI